MSVTQAKLAAGNHVTLGGPYAIAGSMGISGIGSDQVQHEFNHGIDIRVTPANGGYIVSISPRTGYGQVPDLHIVSSDQDLGAEIGKIITLTCLKKEAQ
jgi:hypothetical protein